MSASTAEGDVPAGGAGAVARALLDARSGDAADSHAMQALVRTPEDAYRVQEALMRQLDPGAGTPLYWKSGGPSRAAVLTHAPLANSGILASGCDASALRFRLRLIEGEIALRLREDVGPEQAARMTHEDATRLLDGMCVSIEIVDSRWRQGLAAPALLKLADLQSHGALVLGEWQPFAARDWTAQRCSVRIGDAPPAVFHGSHSLQSPTWLLPAWLRHATRGGAIVRRGTVVTTGTWCAMLPAKRGDCVQVSFDGVGAASVQL